MSTKICLEHKIYVTVKENEGEIIDKMANWAILRLTREVQKTNHEKIEKPITIMRDKVIFLEQLTK